MKKTLKISPVRGWKIEKPGFHQKTIMLRKCGKKCFLGKGVYAAYIRARQYSSKGRTYKNVAAKAKKMLINMGEKR